MLPTESVLTLINDDGIRTVRPLDRSNSGAAPSHSPNRLGVDQAVQRARHRLGSRGRDTWPGGPRIGGVQRLPPEAPAALRLPELVATDGRGPEGLRRHAERHARLG